MPTITHPLLGAITTSPSSATPTHSTRLQYATLTTPLSAPVPTTTAISSAYTPPQPPTHPEFEIFVLGTPIPYTAPLTHTTEGLTLTLTLPVSPSKEPLPVCVFIPGGNFAGGTHAAEWYPAEHLVATSIQLGKPVIFVGIDYRTNLYGFLDHASLPKNRALLDQEVAVEWVRRHAAGFGGDPEQITVMGESAGASSIGYLLARGVEMKRAVMMSGDPVLKGVLPEPIQSSIFLRAVGALGLDPKDPDIIAKIEGLSLEEVYAKLPLDIPWSPAPEESTIAAIGAGGAFVPPKGVELLVGCTRNDGGILLCGSLGVSGIARKALSTPGIEKLAAQYGLTADLDDAAAREVLEPLFTDTMFTLPATGVSDAWRYEFTVPNSNEGMYKGKSNHLYEMAYLFGALPEGRGDMGEDMREVWVKFITGGKPWDGGRVKGFGQREMGTKTLDMGLEEARRLAVGVLMRLV